MWISKLQSAIEHCYQRFCFFYESRLIPYYYDTPCTSYSFISSDDNTPRNSLQIHFYVPLHHPNTLMMTSQRRKIGTERETTYHVLCKMGDVSDWSLKQSHIEGIYCQLQGAQPMAAVRLVDGLTGRNSVCQYTP